MGWQKDAESSKGARNSREEAEGNYGRKIGAEKYRTARTKRFLQKETKVTKSRAVRICDWGKETTDPPSSDFGATSGHGYTGMDRGRKMGAEKWVAVIMLDRKSLISFRNGMRVDGLGSRQLCLVAGGWLKKD